MRNKRIFLCVSLIFVFIISNSACAYYPVIDLGTLGGTHSRARSVNDKGQIVGYAFNSSSDFRACLFDSTGDANNNIDLGEAEGTSINNKGQIVGYNNTVPLGRACYFDSTGDGNNKDLGTLGGSYSQARSINNNNNSKIAGWADNSSGHDRACLFDSSGNGNNIDLGTLGGDESQAYSINDSGQIAGYARNSSSYDRACLFDLTGDANNNIDLGTLGGNDSQANSINNNGQIVGSAQDSYGSFRACLFDPTGDANNNIDLRTISRSESEALSINDKGQIVGYVYRRNSTYERACLFDPNGNGNNTDLNTLIDPSSSWTLGCAYSINNNGWIVGQGTHNGQPRAFLLVIPEPVTIALLTFGGLAILRRKK